MNIEEYKKYEKAILASYDFIREKGLTDSESYTADWISKQQENLKSRRYLVSFSGQIKAGKSTLMNALIFGDEVLPADDNPHTAKISIIKFAEKPGYEVKFYSEQEWEKLCAQPAGEVTYYEKFLKKDEERSARKGVFCREWIRSSAHQLQISGIDGLHEYVAANGAYTPFVNEVAIYHPSEILKTVEFVDTPGTNDPNIFRSQVTEKWISQANANIYVTYANRAMDKVDIDFIDRYLLHVPASKQLIAVNKLDLVDSKADLEEWLEELQQDEELKLRGIFNDTSNIYYTSGLGHLITRYIECGEQMPEELQEYREMIEPKGYLSPEKNGVPNFQEAIEEKICADVGLSVLQSHKGSIEKIYNTRISDIECELHRLKEQSKNAILTAEEIDNRIQQNEKRKNKSKSEFEKFKNDMDTHIENFGMSLKSIFNKHNETVEADIKGEIKKIRNINYFENEVCWIVKRAVELDIPNLYIDMRRIFNDIVKEPVERDIVEFTDNYKDVYSNRVFAFLVKLPLNEAMNSIATETKSQLGSARISEIAIESTNWMQRLFNTKGGQENLKNKLKGEIKNFLDEQYSENIESKVVGIARNELDKYVARIEEGFNRHIYALQNDLMATKDEKGNAKETISRLDQDIADRQEWQKLLKKYADDFCRQMEAI